MFSKLVKVIKISRPAFWPIWVTAYLLGLAAGKSVIGLQAVAEAVLFSLPYCFYMFGLNDIYDMKTDKINKRKGGVWGAVIDKKDTKWILNYSLVAVFAMFLISLFSGNLMHIILAVICLTLPYLYSVPPFRIKERPIFDSIFNATYLFFPFAMGYSLAGGTGFFQIQYLLSALIISAAHAIGTIADLDADKKAGVKTFATVYGPRLPALFATILFLVNIPYAFYVMPSMGLLVLSYVLLSALLIFIPATIKQVSRLALALFIIWVVYAPFAIWFGFETPNV